MNESQLKITQMKLDLYFKIKSNAHLFYLDQDYIAIKKLLVFETELRKLKPMLKQNKTKRILHRMKQQVVSHSGLSENVKQIKHQLTA
jgi:hypothetical protein